MNVSDMKKYRKKHKYVNVLLLLGLDLPFVVAAAVGLKSAVALGMEMLMIHMITVMAAFVTVRALPRWARPIANVTVSTVVMLFARYFIMLLFPTVRSAIGLYIYLMAVNGMTIVQANAVTREDRFLPTVATALVQSLMFTALALATSFVRELLGNGTLWGIPINLPFKFRGMLVPFFGFILIGFLFALLRFLGRKIVAARIRYSLRWHTVYLPSQKTG